MQLERCGFHDRESHVTPPRRSLLGSIEDKNIPTEPDSDEADAEEEEDEDEEEDADDDAYDSGDDKAHYMVEDAQQSVDEGLLHNILVIFICHANNVF